MRRCFIEVKPFDSLGIRCPAFALQSYGLASRCPAYALSSFGVASRCQMSDVRCQQTLNPETRNLSKIPSEAICQGVALAKTEAEAGNTDLVAAEGLHLDYT